MQRTNQQNKALHLYFQMLADELNSAGLDMRKVLKQEIEIPWTKESVKNHLWRPIQQVMDDKESTTELETNEPQQIYAVLSRYISEKFGINVEWPSNV